jgi:hypothetical protein
MFLYGGRGLVTAVVTSFKIYVAPYNVPFKDKPYQSTDRAGLNILPIGLYLVVKPHLPLFPIVPYPLPPYKNMFYLSYHHPRDENAGLC